MLSEYQALVRWLGLLSFTAPASDTHYNLVTRLAVAYGATPKISDSEPAVVRRLLIALGGADTAFTSAEPAMWGAVSRVLGITPLLPDTTASILNRIVFSGLVGIPAGAEWDTETNKPVYDTETGKIVKDTTP